MDEISEEKRYLFGRRHLKYFVILGIVLILLFPLFTYLYYKGALERKNYDKDTNGFAETDLIINNGATTDEIGDLLLEKRLINSKSLFKVYIFQTKQTIKAGHYRVPNNLNVKELVSFLQKGTFDIKLTFLEGWRIEQYSQYISEQFSDPSLGAEFLKIAKPYEGKLFPDTYFVPKSSDANLIFNELRSNFEKKVALFEDRPTTNGLTFEQSLVLASLVEREVTNEKDRAIVAGILIKRMENNWPLDVDATVQYVIGTKKNWWPSKITEEDLNIESPYNTRKVQGLPPTPICNPGINSIEASLNPVATDYWFYLTGKDGVTYFAKTIEEHNENISNYL